MNREEIMEAAANYLLEDIKRGPVLDCPDTVSDFLRCKMDGETEENFCVIWLDTRHRVIDFESLFKGTVDGATVYPRVVAKRALEHNAAACIAVHNHPSGLAEPSLADQAITRRLKEGLSLIDIRLIDHMVVGDEVTSMAARGMV